MWKVSHLSLFFSFCSVSLCPSVSLFVCVCVCLSLVLSLHWHGGLIAVIMLAGSVLSVCLSVCVSVYGYSHFTVSWSRLIIRLRPIHDLSESRGQKVKGQGVTVNTPSRAGDTDCLLCNKHDSFISDCWLHVAQQWTVGNWT